MSRRNGLALAVGVVAFALVTTLVGIASGAPAHFLALDLATGLSFVVAGLAAVWLRPGSPAGPMLLVCGGLWYVGSYAPSGQPVVTWLGFAFERYYDVVLAALLLILSSPAQRIHSRPLIWALAGAMVARSLGRLLLLSPELFGCTDCAPNPFALWPNLDAHVAIEIVSNLAIAAIAALVGIVAIERLLRAGPVWRRIRWPIAVAGGLAMAGAAFDAFEYAWTTATEQPLLDLGEPFNEVFAWTLFGVRTLVPIGFLLATLRLRAAPGPLGLFAAGLERRRIDAVGNALRTALGDPSLQLLRPDGGGIWTAEDGTQLSVPPTAEQGRSVTLVGPKDEPLVAITHDPALLEQPELLEGVVRVLRLALENQRLESELRQQLQRIVTAAEDERRRVERDLHDGAQQRLVGVMLALQQARRTAEADGVSAAVVGDLDAAARETTEAVRELRELARGIHPAILEDEGLGAAVSALARRAGIPVDVRLDLDGRLPPLVESTSYFTIAEALTNTQRHAGATRATVRVIRRPGALEVEVIDNGRGGAAPERGSGLRGLADRVTALGGRLEVDSEAGQGTRIRATIPAA